MRVLARAKRGDLSDPRHEGASYADKKEETEQAIGVSYQIASVGPIDSVAETFDILFQLTVLYEIAEHDLDEYETVRRERNNADGLQGLVDQQKVQKKPPIFEVLNAQRTEVLATRIKSVTPMHGDTDEGGWREFVQLFYELRCNCYEALEYVDFPFTRQLFHVTLGLKTPQPFQMLRPFNEVLPSWRSSSRESALVEPTVLSNQPRPNVYKHSTDVVGCWKLKSHCADFLPSKLIPRAASGERYPIMKIVLYMEQVDHAHVCVCMCACAWSRLSSSWASPPARALSLGLISASPPSSSNTPLTYTHSRLLSRICLTTLHSGTARTRTHAYLLLASRQEPRYFVANSFALIFSITLLSMLVGGLGGSSEFTISTMAVLLLIMAAYKQVTQHTPSPLTGLQSHLSSITIFPSPSVLHPSPIVVTNHLSPITLTSHQPPLTSHLSPIALTLTLRPSPITSLSPLTRSHQASSLATEQGMTAWVPMQGRLNRGDKYFFIGFVVTIVSM